MEQFMHPLFNHHIQNVIKSFQTSAGQSLRGPSGYVVGWGNEHENKMSPEDYESYKRALAFTLKREGMDDSNTLDPGSLPQPVSVKPMPIFIPMDTSSGGLTETQLEGEGISCFEIGGEKRLCLPQILNTLLRRFTMEEVHEASSKLNVFFSRCTPEQLDQLKCSKVLPSSAQSCGLITKTDAERLANRLLRSETHTPENLRGLSTNSFKVYHECFGKCKGVFDPDLYTREESLCVECCECHRMFTPQKFVTHSHKAMENRVCHWGFDSSNWRSYLLLAKDQEHLHSIVKCLKEVKDRFNKNLRKRKQESRNGESEKRLCSGTELAFSNSSKTLERLTSELNQSPPIVLNPEKIVPFSGHDRYDRDFVPNISLAPSSAVKKVKREPSCDARSPLPSTSSEHDVSLEIDVSSVDSDSDDSAVTPRPSSVEDEKAMPERAWEELCEGRQREWALLQQALEGQVGEDTASKEAFIQQYLESRGAEQKLIHHLNATKQDLHKELEETREKKHEYVTELHEWRRTVDQERAEIERLRQQMCAQREQFVRELAQERKQQAAEREQLQGRVTQLQQVQLQMEAEVRYLREQLHNNNRDVTSHKLPPTPLSPKGAILAKALHSPREQIGSNGKLSSPVGAK